MTAALHRARIKAAGHEAVCVSHQLPVETLRRAMTGKTLHHFPTRQAVQPGLADILLLPRGRLRRLGLFGAGRAVRRWVVIASAALVALAGCSTGDDAVAQGGTFEFVAPGGKTDIFYDPPESRGRPGRLAGPSLMDPAKTVSLDDFAGKVVVINVWGQWCGPCRSEIGQLQKVYDATKADGVAFLGIDVRDNNRDAARDFVIDRKVTFPSIYDPSMRTMIAFGGKYPTTVIPSTVVLDREHRVAAVFLRELLAEDLQPVVQRLAAEPVSADMTGLRRDRRCRTASGGARRIRARRAGVVRVAVRGAPGARLSVVPGRGRRRARSSRGRNPRRKTGEVAVSDGRGCGSRARRRCSWRASPRCSCSAPSRCSA